MSQFVATEYDLLCVASAERFEESGWLLDYAGCSTPSLIRARYAKKQLELDNTQQGLYKFRDWLPVKRLLKCDAAPVTYRSEALAKELGLENLYITFNGYFPERGANMQTCSFKETEAYSVCARMDEKCDKILVVASAGNTARIGRASCRERV